MHKELNYQILIETMVRCGGNCSGCALSSSERMSKSDLNFESFRLIALNVNNDLEDKISQGEEFESISIFLGQGDHFLMPEHQISEFMEICSLIIPDKLKNKSLFFISASAIGKHADIKRKMDLFYDLSLKYGVPFFIQVVFDPKKIELNKNFRNTYIDNILYFKSKCGMTELTVNLGSDLYTYMSPIDFHNWVKSHKIAHIEFNWVMNSQTLKMWELSHDMMIEWLINLLTINQQDRSYEVNFVPFITRFLKFKDADSSFINQQIISQLNTNIYYDINGHRYNCQTGLISNLIPYNERLSESSSLTSKEIAVKIQSTIQKNLNCSSCEYSKVCSLLGSSIWIKDLSINKCPYDIYRLIKFIDQHIGGHLNPSLSTTIFDKNPVQSEKLINQGQETYEYFVEKVYNKAN